MDGTVLGLRSGLLRLGLDVKRARREPTGANYSGFNEQAIIADLLAPLDVARFCVDIAAGDGRQGSNTLALYERGWAGLSVELDGGRFAALAERHAQYPASRLARARVTPGNVRAVLAAAEVPRDVGFLSLDIDGYDHDVLDSILAGYRPTLICAEINEKIPPPLRFTVRYRDGYEWQGDHFYGQSISQLETLARRHGYAIVGLEYNNAFLMPTDLAPVSLTARDAYRVGYAEREDRLRFLPWNADMEPLQHMAPADAVAWLDTHFSQHRGEYDLTV